MFLSLLFTKLKVKACCVCGYECAAPEAVVYFPVVFVVVTPFYEDYALSLTVDEFTQEVKTFDAEFET